ncbi:hypothetical protein VTK73DRAFT_8255 [Phialemonium thermophilum]|uniref:Uncharacterized protein n=1 Tax=Phialemonium thermophilum TaxID=223376 RepID=A0ABR3XPV6_9PEZI
MSDLTIPIVYCVLVGILIKPTIILWFVSLFLARVRGDPVRVAFRYIKVAFPLFVIALIGYTGAEVVNAVNISIHEGYYYDYDDIFNRLNNANLRLGTIGDLFERWTDVFVLIAQAELGMAFFHLASGSRHSLHLVVRLLAVGFGSVIFILAVACFGRTQVVWNVYFTGYDEEQYVIFRRNLLTLDKLNSAIEILLWISSLPLLALASASVYKVCKLKALQSSSIIFLVTTILNLIRYTYMLAYDARYLLGSETRVVPRGIVIVQAVLDQMILFVLLVLLFVIGIRKRNGLWSTEQPWTKGPIVYAPVPQQTQAGWVQSAPYGAPQQVQGQPLQYQQYPQQYQPYAPQAAVYAMPTQPQPGFPQQGFPQQAWAPQPQEGMQERQQVPSPQYVPSPQPGTRELSNSPPQDEKIH